MKKKENTGKFNNDTVGIIDDGSLVTFKEYKETKSNTFAGLPSITIDLEHRSYIFYLKDANIHCFNDDKYEDRLNQLSLSPTFFYTLRANPTKKDIIYFDGLGFKNILLEPVEEPIINNLDLDEVLEGILLSGDKINVDFILGLNLHLTDNPNERIKFINFKVKPGFEVEAEIVIKDVSYMEKGTLVYTKELRITFTRDKYDNINTCLGEPLKMMKNVNTNMDNSIGRQIGSQSINSNTQILVDREEVATQNSKEEVSDLITDENITEIKEDFKEKDEMYLPSSDAVPKEELNPILIPDIPKGEVKINNGGSDPLLSQEWGNEGAREPIVEPNEIKDFEQMDNVNPNTMKKNMMTFKGLEEKDLIKEGGKEISYIIKKFLK